jgi:hypothetical protein
LSYVADCVECEFIRNDGAPAGGAKFDHLLKCPVLIGPLETSLQPMGVYKPKSGAWAGAAGGMYHLSKSSARIFFLKFKIVCLRRYINSGSGARKQI